MGVAAPARQVDHIVPHKSDPLLFWDQGNWQGACDWHHDTVKQQLEAMFARGEIGAGELRLDSATALRLSGARGGIETLEPGRPGPVG